MPKPFGAAFLLACAAAFVSAGCLFGGGDDPVSIERPGSIPTATPPARLPDPMLVGEVQAGVGPATSAVTGETTYVVKSGDTLGAIAAQFGIPAAQQASWVAEVLRLNGIPDATLLQAGVELRLPRITPTPRPTGTVTPRVTITATAALGAARTVTPATSPAASATAGAQSSATPRPTVVAGAGTYTVVSGDNPTLIGQKLGVPASALAAWADQLMTLNGTNASSLQVGQVLQLPPIPAAPTSTP